MTAFRSSRAMLFFIRGQFNRVEEGIALDVIGMIFLLENPVNSEWAFESDTLQFGSFGRQPFALALFNEIADRCGYGASIGIKQVFQYGRGWAGRWSKAHSLDT